MADITFRSDSAFATVTASINLQKPTGTVSGDGLVSILESDGATALVTSAPSGWTLLYGPINNGSSGTAYLYYKVAGGGEPGNYVWNFNNPAPNYKGLMVCFFNNDISTPIDASSSNINFDSSPTGLSITPNFTNDMSLIMYGSIGAPSAALSGYTETPTQPNVSGTWQAAYYKLLSSNAATGNLTISTAPATSGWFAFNILLRNASAGPVNPNNVYSAIIT